MVSQIFKDSQINQPYTLCLMFFILKLTASILNKNLFYTISKLPTLLIEEALLCRKKVKYLNEDDNSELLCEIVDQQKSNSLI